MEKKEITGDIIIQLSDGRMIRGNVEKLSEALVAAIGTPLRWLRVERKSSGPVLINKDHIVTIARDDKPDVA